MMNIIKRMIKNQGIRYVFFGGCTTMVNLLSYWILRTFLHLDITRANMIAIGLAILFAYVVNKVYVFESKRADKKALIKEFLQFIGMRLFTMFIEIFGVVALCCVWGIWDMASKLLIQVVVLVLNFIFSKMYVFQENPTIHLSGNSVERDSRKICIWLGTLIPAITVLIAYIVNGVFPFGDRGVLIIDSLHQYLPFFTDFHEKLVNNTSILYSFGGGLGYNMWAAYAYYLASPLNLLITLVSMDHVIDFMAYLILVKIALSGGFFAWYLAGKSKKETYLPIPFACMYALSAFMIGYYFNLMWLDSIMVVPLIMYGVEHIVKGKNGRFYCLALAYALFCNYYIGYMLCLFSTLYFITLWIAARKTGIKRFMLSCLKFGWFSLLSGGMAAVVLIPAFMNLQITESAGSSFPTKLKFYTNELIQLSGHFAFVEPINIYDDQSGVNIYCGVIVMILFLLFLFDKKIRMSERISKMMLVVLLGLSMNCNILNYIWHGFHVQNGLPNRFAFLYIAMLLSVGYDTLQHIRKARPWVLIIAWVIPISFVAYSMLMEIGDREWYVYIFTLLLLVVYGVLLLIMSNSTKKIVTYLLTSIMTIEMVATGIYGISCNGTVSRSTYVDEQQSYQKMMKRREQGKEDDQNFFRSEIDSQHMRNENMFMGANGLVLFSSTMPEATVNLCRSIGMEARTNKNGYVGVTKLFNDVFGIRYVVSKTDAEALNTMEQIDYESPLYLYENKDALSLGFMVNSDIKKWDINTGDALDVQAQFVELATGIPFRYTLREAYELEEGPTYIIRLHPGEETILDVQENVKSLTVKTPQSEKTYNNYTNNLFLLGRVEEEGENSKANVSLTYKDGHSDTVSVKVYTCSDEEYQEVYESLAESQMEDVQVRGNRISAKINAKKSGTLLLTIPYDNGWKIMIDDEEVETYRVGEALTGIDLDSGEHTIRMKFFPEGFWEGSLITLICLALYLASAVLEGQRKKKSGGK